MKNKTSRRVAAAGLSALLPAVCLTALPPMSASAAGNVVLNEVCTKNTTFAAPDGQYYDYIELYNSGDSPVTLDGYGLSDDAAQPYSYTFPAGSTIAPRSFLLVWCGVNEGTAGAPFGLSKNGETLTMSDSSGNIVSQLEVPGLADDTAFGRMPDGSDQFAILDRLTPGSSNPNNAAAEIVVEAPAFSQDSGFYSNDFELTLSAKQGSTIYYTTDGSDPTTSSERYSAPIKVYNKTNEQNVYAAETDISSSYGAPSYNVNKAMIVRAIAVDAQGNVSNIKTNSYFVGYGANSLEKNMRVISLVTDPDNLFDYEKGIYVRGKVYDDWRKGPEFNPQFREWEQPGNYTQSGREWERPASITVFENGTAAYSTDVGIRIHGGATRSAAQKSLNLYARADYGDTKIRYDFYGGTVVDENGKVIDSFDKLTLRNGGNDNTSKIRDRINHEAVSGRDIGTQAQTECVVFIDGEFWGTYNIVEKLGKEYISDHFGVKEKDVCMIKTDELSDGSEQGWADYEALKRFAESTNFSDRSAYEKFCEMVDVQSFADYMAAELIVANSDFIDNNYCLWKTETIDDTRMYADGKWRFILFDTEYGQGLYGQSNSNTNTMQTLKQKNKWLSKLFFGLLENSEEFRQVFVPTYFDLCNDNYSSKNMLAAISKYEALYTKPNAETERRFSGTPAWGGWGGWGGQQDFTQSVSKEINSVRDFWQSRDTNAKQILLNYLGGKISNQTVTVTLKDPGAKDSVQLNTLKPTFENGSWSGTYPKDCLITLKAEAPSGTRFAGWVIKGAEFAEGSENTASVQLKPRENQVTIEAKFEIGSSQEELFTADDVNKLRQYLLVQGSLTSTEAQQYDIDGNGKLSAADLTAMKHEILKRK